MAREFSLTVVAPDRAVVEETVTSVIVPGVEGEFGVLAGHAPIVAALKPGSVQYLDPRGNRHYVYVGGGFAEVGASGVTVLADEAQRAHEIDVQRAEESLEKARRSLRGEEGSPLDEEESVLELERAIARRNVARNVHGR